ncbi:hypothetical protein KA183_05445 [bacterium]|nr:hypothetical protein [bacterium]QQR56639.1 MAG: hypothetical protein IPG59_16775 [Candidatus Melainabacteria bacterium]
MNTQIPNKIEDLQEHCIEAAQSSLDCFFLKLDSGFGLILKPNKTTAVIEAAVVSVEHLPTLSEAVCAVDWTWICRSKIELVKQSPNQIMFKLNPAGPLKVKSGVWQNKPYLFFEPYKGS